MSIKADRFNLPNMVTRQLSRSNKMLEVKTKSPEISQIRIPEAERVDHIKLPDVNKAMKHIVTNVHNTMKIPLPKPKHKLKILRSTDLSKIGGDMIKECDLANNKLLDNNNMTKAKKMRSFIKSIPQNQAQLEAKIQQAMRRPNISPEQRAREILRHKRVLEEMLAEHQKIQRDRASIAFEIRSMKNYLEEIRHKLDFSLKKLNTTNLSDRCKTIKPKYKVKAKVQTK